MLERWTAKSKCYIWLYRASRDAKYPFVLYEYQQKPEGGGERCGMFLKGFVGWLCGAAGLQYCNVLFAIEKELDELPSEKLYIQRLSLSRPAMDAFGHGRKRKPPLRKSVPASANKGRLYTGGGQRETGACNTNTPVISIPTFDIVCLITDPH